VTADGARLAEALAGEAAARAAALEEIRSLDVEAAAALLDARLAAALVEMLASPSRGEQRAAAEVVAALASRHAPLAAALDAALDDPRQRLRWGAAFTLGRASAAPPRRLWPAVREAMALEDGDQRWAAAELATRLAREDEAVAAAMREAARDPSALLRRMALYGLRDLAPPDLGRTALAALDDPDATVRLAALAALVGSPAAPEERARAAAVVTGRLAADPDAGVRRAAAATLGRLGVPTPEVRSALDTASDSPDESLARAARGARERLARPPGDR
jgi:HEAT repeat protein